MEVNHAVLLLSRHCSLGLLEIVLGRDHVKMFMGSEGGSDQCSVTGCAAAANSVAFCKVPSGSTEMLPSPR